MAYIDDSYTFDLGHSRCFFHVYYFVKRYAWSTYRSRPFFGLSLSLCAKVLGPCTRDVPGTRGRSTR